MPILFLPFQRLSLFLFQVLSHCLRQCYLLIVIEYPKISLLMTFAVGFQEMSFIRLWKFLSIPSLLRAMRVFKKNLVSLWTVFKSLLNLLQPKHCFCFMFCFFDHEACGILAHWPGIEPAPPALKGKVLTTGLKQPGKSYSKGLLRVLFWSNPTGAQFGFILIVWSFCHHVLFSQNIYIV